MTLTLKPNFYAADFFTYIQGQNIADIWFECRKLKKRNNIKNISKTIFIDALKYLIENKGLIIDCRALDNEFLPAVHLLISSQTETIEWFASNLPDAIDSDENQFDPDYWLGGPSKPDDSSPRSCAWILDDGSVTYRD